MTYKKNQQTHFSLSISFFPWIEILFTGLWWFGCGYILPIQASINFFSSACIPPLFIWIIGYLYKQTQHQKRQEQMLQKRLDMIAYPNLITESIETGISNSLAQKSQYLTNLSKETVDTLTPLISSFQSQTQTFEQLKTSNESLSREITKQISQLDNLFNELLNKYSILENQSTQHIKELKNTWTDIIEQSENVHGMLRVQTSESSDVSQKIVQITQNIQEEYQKQTDNLNHTLQESSKHFINNEESLQKYIQFIEQATSRIIDQMNTNVRQYESLIESRILSTQDSLTKHVHEMSILCDQLTQKVQDSVNIFDLKKDRFSELEQEFLISFKQEIKNILDYAEQKTTYVKDVLNKQHNLTLTTIEKMNLMCKETEQTINKDTNSIYTTLKKESDLLDNFIAQFKEQSRSIHNALADQVNILSKASIETERQSESILKTIKHQTESLYTNSTQAIDNFNKIALLMERQSVSINKSITDSNTLFDLTINNFFSKSDQISELSSQIAEQMKENAYTLSSHGKSLFEYADRASKIHTNNMMLIDKNMNSIKQHIDTESKNIKNVVNDLHNYGNEISIASDKANQSITDIGNNLNKQYKLFKETSLTIQHIFRNMSDQLTQKTHHFVKEFQDAAKMAEHSTKIFDTQIAQLIQSSQSAYAEASQLKIQQEKFHRGLFMKAARFITEDLHAMSIDLTRILDSKISESDWKRYIKGDRGIFTRTLIQSSRQDKLINVLTQEIRNNHELRMYVIKYVELFDKIIKDAQKVDQEWLLFSTFTTSDVGKLYMILCKAIGHTPPAEEEIEHTL